MSFSEQSEMSLSEVDDEVDDAKIAKILSKQIQNYEVLDLLPPTPKRPATRSQGRASVSPAVSMLSSASSSSRSRGKKKVFKPVKVLQDEDSSDKSSRKSTIVTNPIIKKERSVKDICADLHIDLEDSELEEIENDDLYGGIKVDTVIEDLIGVGIGRTKVCGPAKVRESTVEEEKLCQQFENLRSKKPLDINGDGRCVVLHQDMTTVKETLESVKALISVLEKTRDKLVSVCV